ncbi:hypothetical protein ACFL0K_03325, partial [Patescibacteria group bacterium]
VLQLLDSSRTIIKKNTYDKENLVNFLLPYLDSLIWIIIKTKNKAPKKERGSALTAPTATKIHEII